MVRELNRSGGDGEGGGGGGEGGGESGEGSIKAEAERVFKLADSSLDGKLDLDELAKMTGFAKMGKSLMGKADGDGDGRLTMQEWVAFIESKGDNANKVLQLYENALPAAEAEPPSPTPSATARQDAALMAQGLRLTTTMAGLAMSGRLDGMQSVEAAAMEGQDLRAKCFAVLQQLGFGEAEGGAAGAALTARVLTPEQQLQLQAVREYRAFSEAETWRDVEEELQAEGCRPVSADAAALSSVLDATQQVATGVLDRQQRFSATMADGDATAESEMLTRVRTLRDGPMGMPKLQKTDPNAEKGESLFRKRIAAKARIGGMVAASKVGYEGPMPSAEEYADAKVAEFKELRGKKGLKLKDVPESLDSLAAAAGLEASHVAPFLERQGIQEELEAPPGQAVKIAIVDTGSAPIHALVDIVAGVEPANAPFDDARLKELMLEFQAAEAR